jgi:hypothetical protein
MIAISINPKPVRPGGRIRAFMEMKIIAMAIRSKMTRSSFFMFHI